MRKFVRQLMPNQEFILMRTGERYKFMRRDYSTPSGTRYVCLHLGPISVDDYPVEISLHHACHVWVQMEQPLTKRKKQMTDRELMQQALEALELYQSRMSVQMFDIAVTALRERLAQPEQEPVQTTPNFKQLKQILDNLDRCHHRDSKQEFLRTWIRDWTEHKLSKHTSPQPSKPWVGLTDEDIGRCFDGADGTMGSLIAAIEAKLKEKNT